MNNSSEMPPNQEEPQNSEAGPGNRYPLAGRLERLAAYMIDSLILLLAVSPLTFIFDIASIAEAEADLPMRIRVLLSLAVLGAFILINGTLLKQRGQTLGKRYMKLAIVDMNGDVPDFQRMIVLRYIPFWFLGLFPLLQIIALAENITIFQKEKRCIHDLIAGTKVIDVSIPR